MLKSVYIQNYTYRQKNSIPKHMEFFLFIAIKKQDRAI